MEGKPVHSRAAREAWRAMQTRCAACWRPVSDPPWLGFAVHHIVRRNRPDEPCAMLFLCGFCHAACHVSVIENGQVIFMPLGAQLTIKSEERNDEWDPIRLRELRHGEALPDFLPIPEWFLQERRRWTR